MLRLVAYLGCSFIFAYVPTCLLAFTSIIITYMPLIYVMCDGWEIVYDG